MKFEGALFPLGDIPLDGSIEMLSSGCDEDLLWIPFTPKHHLAAHASGSSVMVVVRRRQS